MPRSLALQIASLSAEYSSAPFFLCNTLMLSGFAPCLIKSLTISAFLASTIAYVSIDFLSILPLSGCTVSTLLVSAPASRSTLTMPRSLALQIASLSAEYSSVPFFLCNTLMLSGFAPCLSKSLTISAFFASIIARVSIDFLSILPLSKCIVSTPLGSAPASRSTLTMLRS